MVAGRKGGSKGGAAAKAGKAGKAAGPKKQAMVGKGRGKQSLRNEAVSAAKRGGAKPPTTTTTPTKGPQTQQAKGKGRDGAGSTPRGGRAKASPPSSPSTPTAPTAPTTPTAPSPAKRMMAHKVCPSCKAVCPARLARCRQCSHSFFRKKSELGLAPPTPSSTKKRSKKPAALAPVDKAKLGSTVQAVLDARDEDTLAHMTLNSVLRLVSEAMGVDVAPHRKVVKRLVDKVLRERFPDSGSESGSGSASSASASGSSPPPGARARARARDANRDRGKEERRAANATPAQVRSWLAEVNRGGVPDVVVVLDPPPPPPGKGKRPKRKSQGSGDTQAAKRARQEAALEEARLLECGPPPDPPVFVRAPRPNWLPMVHFGVLAKHYVQGRPDADADKDKRKPGGDEGQGDKDKGEGGEGEGEGGKGEGGEGEGGKGGEPVTKQSLMRFAEEKAGGWFVRLHSLSPGDDVPLQPVHLWLKGHASAALAKAHNRAKARKQGARPTPGGDAKAKDGRGKAGEGKKRSEAKAEPAPAPAPPSAPQTPNKKELTKTCHHCRRPTFLSVLHYCTGVECVESRKQKKAIGRFCEECIDKHFGLDVPPEKGLWFECPRCANVQCKFKGCTYRRK